MCLIDLDVLNGVLGERSRVNSGMKIVDRVLTLVLFCLG